MHRDRHDFTCLYVFKLHFGKGIGAGVDNRLQQQEVCVEPCSINTKFLLLFCNSSVTWSEIKDSDDLTYLYGSEASLRPSPRKLNASITIMTGTTGKSSQG